MSSPHSPAPPRRIGPLGLGTALVVALAAVGWMTRTAPAPEPPDHLPNRVTDSPNPIPDPSLSPPAPAPAAAQDFTLDRLRADLTAGLQRFPGDAFPDWLQTYCRNLSDADLQKVVTLTWTTPELSDLLEAAVRESGVRDPATLRDRIMGEPEDRRITLMTRLAGGWATVDAKGALAWMSALPDPSRIAEAVCLAARQVAVLGDPVRAVDALLPLKDESGTRSVALAEALRQMATTNAPLALAQLQRLPANDPERRIQLVSVADGFARRDPQAALDLIVSQATDEDLAPLVTRVLGPVVGESPERLLPWAVKELDAPLAGPLVADVAVTWAQRDTAACLKWLGSGCPDTIRPHAAQEVLESGCALTDAMARQLTDWIPVDQRKTYPDGRLFPVATETP